MTNEQILGIVQKIQPCSAMEIKQAGKALDLEAEWDDHFLNQLASMVTEKKLTRSNGWAAKGGQTRVMLYKIAKPPTP